MLTRAACVVALAGLASLASGQIQYVSQDRWVSLTGSGTTDQESSASDFAAFNGNLTAGFGTVATQSSGLEPLGIVATGTAQGATTPPAGTGNISARSSFAVVFDLLTEAEYTLDLDVFAEFATWSFQGPSLNIEQGLTTPFTLSGFEQSGTLGPGQYSFAFEINTSGAASGILSTYDFRFDIVPTPGVCAVLAVGALATTRRRHK
ncbi:MAG: hypothetical protein AAGB51_10565 [Planctomycetota bacterium]